MLAIRRPPRCHDRLFIACFSTQAALKAEVSSDSSNNSNTDSLEATAKDIISSAAAKRKEALKQLKGEVQIKSLETIIQESKLRYRKRYDIPSQNWAQHIQNSYRSKSPQKGFVATSQLISENFEKESSKLTIADVFSPLDVGDAVELGSSLNQSALAVVVEVPSSDDDPRYTIMNKLGELQYLERSLIKFRIPRLIPKEWLTNIVYRVHDPTPDYGCIKTTLDHFETYAVSPFARKVIVKPLLRITSEAWTQLPKTSRKLELIHRVIQTDGPKEVSLFTLLKAIHCISIPDVKDYFDDHDIDTAYLNLRKNLQEDLGNIFSTDSLSLGKEVGELSENDAFDVSTFYSVVLALRKQNRLWSTSYASNSTLIPLSVTVLPLSYALKVDSTVELLKNNPSIIDEFNKFVSSSNRKDIPESLNSIFFILKEYASGNIDDPKIVTLICQLMKSHYKSDVTRTLVYDFLVETGYIPASMINPTHLSTTLSFPNSGISNKAVLEQQYFDLFDVNDLKDDLARNRSDLSDLRVYCIDSETAHEIDDGVSIAKIDNENVRLYIHVADPSSYFSPELSLAKIAFERAFTTYQPETILPMLPKSISELAGLGVNGVRSRALTFSVPFNKVTGEFSLDEAKVEASVLSNFPKYTYDDVDEVLQGIKASDTKSNVSIEHEELHELYKVAVQLRNNRIENGAVVFGESLNSQVSVTANINTLDESIGGGIDESVSINVSKQKLTDSVVLVSELMILGNRIAGEILSKNQLSGIYKGMSKLSLTGTADTVVERLNKYTQETSKLPSLSQIVKTFKFIVPAFYSYKPLDHLMLGVDKYAPSTSPLRRFGDLVNHYQFHSFLNGSSPLFTHEQIIDMTLHIEARNDILKKASRNATGFYAMKILEDKISNGEHFEKSFMVTSRPVDGNLFGLFLDFGIFARMKLSANRKPPAIGDVLTNFEIIEIDRVGNSLSLRELD